MPTVDLFVTCMVDQFRPQAGIAAVSVLERRAAPVDFPQSQTCCGQFVYNAGHHDEARALARHFIQSFDSPEGRPIVSLSGSCAAMVVHEYPRLISLDDPIRPAMERVIQRIQEFSQYLDGQRRATPSVDTPPSAVTMAVHHGCHMRRVLGITHEPVNILRSTGVEPVELPDADQCCGFGGTYSMTESAVSTAIADEKLKALTECRARGAQALVGADLGCLLHLGGRLSRKQDNFPVLYLAEVIDLADQNRLDDAHLAAIGPLGRRIRGEAD